MKGIQELKEGLDLNLFQVINFEKKIAQQKIKKIKCEKVCKARIAKQTEFFLGFQFIRDGIASN